MNKDMDLEFSVRVTNYPVVSRSDKLPEQKDHIVNVGDNVYLQHEGNILSVKVVSYDDSKFLFTGKLLSPYGSLIINNELTFFEKNIFEIEKT